MALKSDKIKTTFVHKGITYSGYIISSTDLDPHFHWFVFDDVNVIAKYGDSIAFKLEDGKLIPVYHLTSPLFVQAVLDCVQRNLNEMQL